MTTMDFVVWTLALVARVWLSDIPDRLFNNLVTHLNKDKLFQIFGKINTKEIPLLCCKVKKKCGFMTNEGYIWCRNRVAKTPEFHGEVGALYPHTIRKVCILVC